jgi:hypothetical protein
MKTIALLVTLSCASLALPASAQTQVIRRMPAEDVTLDKLLAPETLFKYTKEAFMKDAAPLGFEWTSSAQDAARSARPRTKYSSHAVYETIVRFDGDKPKDATVLFYGRGDTGEISEAQFTALIKSSIGALDALTGKKFAPRGKDAKSAVKADGVTWSTDTGHYTLEYSFTKENKSKGIPYRAEFIRLEILPPMGKKSLLETALANTSTAKRFDPRTQVKRESNGDVIIPTVPMVDQGQKGYCAVATAERVMRYYGVQTDANEIAQIANSDADRGTSSKEMVDGLKRIQGRLKIRVKPEIESDYREFTRLVEDYNRAAKRAKAKELPDPKKFMVMWTAYSSMDAAILKEVKLKDSAGYNKFLRTVSTNIDQGVPLAWSVQLGLYPEPNIPQGAGGHMRLIVGYNSKTQELIFSDSWGAGHEAKRMPTQDAWSITTGLTRIEPSGSD